MADLVCVSLLVRAVGTIFYDLSFGHKMDAYQDWEPLGQVRQSKASDVGRLCSPWVSQP